MEKEKEGYCQVIVGNSIMQTNDYLNFCGDKKDDGLFTIYF